LAKIRAFIAIEIPEETKKGLKRLLETLKTLCPIKAISWSKPETMHVTIKFLGDIEDADIEKISRTLQEAAKHATEFDITAKGIGAFPSPKSPRVVWVGIDGSGALKSLHAAIDKGLAQLAIPKNDKPFSPHLTLCRVREKAAGKGIREAIEKPDVKFEAAWKVTEITLFKSALKPDGALHTPLSTVKLGG